MAPHTSHISEAPAGAELGRLAPAWADFSSSLGRLVKYFVNDKFRKSLSAVSKLSFLSGSNFDVLSKPEGTSDRKWFPNEGID